MTLYMKPSNLGDQFATLGGQFMFQHLNKYPDIINVVAFISNLGPICNPKMLKVGPEFFFGDLSPSVKQALCLISGLDFSPP
jgi:hypothetical protein